LFNQLFLLRTFACIEVDPLYVPILPRKNVLSMHGLNKQAFYSAECGLLLLVSFGARLSHNSLKNYKEKLFVLKLMGVFMNGLNCW